jgi:hypothetical protein
VAAWVLSGILQPLPEASRAAILAIIALAMVLRDLDVLRFNLPQNSRLVPQTIFLKGQLLAAFQFGLELGSGVRTYVSSSAPYLLLAAVLLFGPHLAIALMVGIGFGLGRASTAALRYWSSNGDKWDQLLDGRIRLLVRLCSVSAAGSVTLLLLR